MNLFESTAPESAQLGLPISQPHLAEDLELINKILEIYDQGQLAAKLNEVGSQHCRETVNRWVKGKLTPRLTYAEHMHLKSLLPSKPTKKTSFTFIDLFAGIGGIRKGFEAIGGECVFTSEWNPFAVRTYKANHYCDPERHRFNREQYKANNPAQYLWSRAKARALRKGHEFTITKEWVQERLTAGVCEMTGLPFDLDLGTAAEPNPWSPTIDRRDSRLGYTPDNCRLVTWVYNAAKNSWGDDIVLEMAEALVERANE